MKIRSKTLTAVIVLFLLASFFLTSGFSFVSLLEKASPDTSPSSTDTITPFSDVGGNWAEAAIAEMYAKNVMRGYEDSTFKPKKPVTFLEAAVMIDKLLWGKPSVDDANSNRYLHDQFNIPEWAVGYIASAMKNNILMWSELQKASREQPMTREDAAVLAVRALELTQQAKAKKNVTLPFTDANQITEAVKTYVSLAYERRIIDGYPDGTFQPSNPLSRAEMAVFLSNIAQQIPSVNAGETSGFIKATNVLNNSVTLTNDDGREFDVKLPAKSLIYLDDAPATINQLIPGNHLRMIANDSAPITVVIAESVLPDNGSEAAMEQVNPTAASADILQWVDTNKISENYLYQVFGNNLYFLATRGEKMYSGYSVEIRKVSYTTDDQGIHYRVWLDRSDPARNTFILPTLSYTFALVRVASPDQPISSVTFVDKLNQVISEVKTN